MRKRYMTVQEMQRAADRERNVVVIIIGAMFGLAFVGWWFG